MKKYLSPFLAALLLAASGYVFAADEESDGSSMKIEKIITACEEQYTEENYPDPDERNNMIDQCIDENTVNKQQEEG